MFILGNGPNSLVVTTELAPLGNLHEFIYAGGPHCGESVHQTCLKEAIKFDLEFPTWVRKRALSKSFLKSSVF